LEENTAPIIGTITAITTSQVFEIHAASVLIDTIAVVPTIAIRTIRTFIIKTVMFTYIMLTCIIAQTLERDTCCHQQWHLLKKRRPALRDR
jgi:hypothetical protein